MTYDGVDALWRAREHPYSAIVLDLLLPGMNGFEVCRTLRADGVWTPILVLTAKTGEWDEAEALDTGADDFLSKPFSFVVLVARLRALVRRGSTPRGRRCSARARSCSIRSPTRAIDAATEVRLTPREFGVLASLLRRPAAASRSRRSSTRCGVTSSAATPTSSRCTSRYLRRKIDTPFGLDTIETVRHVGYRMVADVA